MANQQPTLTTLTTSLTAQSLPTPHQTFLLKIITPTSQTKPLAVLTATARHRLLSANLTTPNILAASTSSLPPNISNVRTVSSTLTIDVFVQVLDILDIGASKWAQVELLESERKGETTKGREVIRVPPSSDGLENDRGSSAATQQIQPPAAAANTASKLSSGPHKVLLQDVKGNKMWGFELKKVDKIVIGGMAGGGMSIGCKMWLKRGCKVARGTVLLEPGTCNILGGKIEDLDKAWRKGREQRLREKVVRDRDAGVEE